MATDRLTPDDADRMREFADRCSRVARTARTAALAETGQGEGLLKVVSHRAEALVAALRAAAHYADPEEGDPDDS